MATAHTSRLRVHGKRKVGLEVIALPVVDGFLSGLSNDTSSSPACFPICLLLC